MEWHGWLTTAVVVVVLLAMIWEIAGPDLILAGALATLAAAGVLTPEETFAGFANEGLATVAALFVVAAALHETGAVTWFVARIFGRSGTETGGLRRMTGVVAAASAFLNNTPIVAMMTPVVIDWTRRHRFAPSRFLIPLSFATILGGVLTLIGTSTNLVVAGLVRQAQMPPLGFFEIGWVGLPVCLAGIAYLWIVAPRLLPDRRDPGALVGSERREYTATMLVGSICPMVGQSVEEAGLRHLPGLFLVEIDRDDRTITPVAPDETIAAGDRLVFAGVVSTIIDLHRISGLTPVAETTEPANAPGRRLIEAVVSHSSALVGQSIRDASFRTVYDAAVIAVHRNGERVGGKIGEIVLRPGDTLLLQGAPGFVRAHRNSPAFYLVSEVGGPETPRADRAGIALAILLAMITTATFEWLPISIAAFVAAGAMIATGCLSGSAARRSVEWPVLIVVGAGIGIAEAMAKSGAADAIAGWLVAGAADFGPIAGLTVIYFVTLFLTEVLTNNAAAALMFPIGVATATQLGVDPRGFVIAVMIAASCGFASPLGYQTHLIVYGPGGYRFGDFVRVGLPLDVLCGIVALTVIPWVWGF